MLPLWRWIKNQFVQKIPDDIALCEFDCHRKQCTHAEWADCPRRLSGAAGELRPEKKARAPAEQG